MNFRGIISSGVLDGVPCLWMSYGEYTVLPSRQDHLSLWSLAFLFQLITYCPHSRPLVTSPSFLQIQTLYSPVPTEVSSKDLHQNIRNHIVRLTGGKALRQTKTLIRQDIPGAQKLPPSSRGRKSNLYLGKVHYIDIFIS